MDQGGVKLPVPNLGSNEGDRKMEASGTRTSGVHEPTTWALGLEERLVGVTKDHDIGVGEDPPEPKGGGSMGGEVPVDHLKPEPLEGDLGRLGKAVPNLPSIGVPMDGGDRSQRLKFDEEVQGTQVSGVEDVIHPFESRDGFLSQQPVGIGQNAEFQVHRVRIRPPGRGARPG